MKPVVFVSHSSQDNVRATALRQALAATGALDTAFDRQDLIQGEAYRPQLFRWMARCHGAVLLLTTGVMDNHEWVLQEATFLAARALLEGPAFRLYVLIDEAVYKHPTWTQAFTPLKLPELQRTKLVNPTDPIDGFVQTVASGMAGVVAFGEEHHSRLAERIFDALEPFIAAASAKRALAEWARQDDAAWQDIVSFQHALRALYARRFAVEDLMQRGGLTSLFNRLQDKGDPRQRTDLLSVLQSHWVPLDQASVLAEAVRALRPVEPEAVPPNVVVLQTEFPAAGSVAELYHHRRFMPYGQLGRWVPVPWGNEGEDAFAEAVRQALQRKFFASNADVTADTIVSRLAKQLGNDVMTFVHVPGVQTAAHLLPTARRYWPCLFVLTADGDTSQQLAAELKLTPIGPPRQEEEDCMYDIDDARGLLAQ